MAQRIASGSTAAPAFVEQLWAAYQGHRLPDPAYALRNDPDFWAKAQRNDVVARSVTFMKDLVAGLHWKVVPASKEPVDRAAAAITEDLLKEIVGFLVARRLLVEAAFRGRSLALCTGDRRLRTPDGTVPMLWWAPTALVHVDPFRLEKRRIESGPKTGEIAWHFWSFERQVYEVFEHPEWFVRWTYDDEERDLGYGTGLQDPLAFLLWLQAEVQSDIAAGGRRIGRGVYEVLVDSLADGTPGTDADAVVDAWKEKIAIVREEGDLVHDKKDEVKQLASPGESALRALRDIGRDLEERIDRLFLSGTLSTGGGSSTGSLARAEVEDSSTSSRMQSLRHQLSEAIDSGPCRLIWHLNRVNFMRLGLSAARPGKFKIFDENEHTIPVGAEILSKVLAAGMDVKEDEAYELVDLTPPRRGDADPAPGVDRVVKARAPAPTAPFMAPGETQPVLAAADRGDRDVKPANIHFAPTINLPRQDPPVTNVTVQPPQQAAVTVFPPNVNVTAPVTVNPAPASLELALTLEAPKRGDEAVTFERDAQGRITRAQIGDQPS